MTLNTMLNDHVNEGIRTMSKNDFLDDMDTSYSSNAYPLEVIEPINFSKAAQNPTHIRWQIFDEIPERVYTIECEGYVDKNDKPLADEESIKYITDGEPMSNNIEVCDENSDVIEYMDYEDYYYCMDHNKYDLRKITKQIRTKKFICEVPIRSGKSTAMRQWISAHSKEKFMVIVPTVNIAEEFHAKLYKMNSELDIRFCVNENTFSEFHKAVHNGVNIIITAYSTSSKCLGDLLEEYYEREQRLGYFLVIDEAHLLLQHPALLEKTKEFDMVALISATTDDIKHFACFRDYITSYIFKDWY